MCGLIGIFSNKPDFKKHKEYILQSLYADTLRGSHGTGLACIPFGKRPIIHKKPVPGYDYIDMRSTEGLLFDADKYNCIIGHNRYKTHGIMSQANTHPFNHGHITLAHNGMVHSNKFTGKYDVDSENVCHALSKMPAEELIPTLTGAFALVWWDEEQQAMFAIRNDERPLFFSKEKDKETIYYASEAGMLRWICGRIGIELEPIWSPKPGQLLKFEAGNIVPVSSFLDVYKKPPPVPVARSFPAYDHKNILTDNKIHIGQKIIASPVAWVKSALKNSGTPYGDMYFMSTEYKCRFVLGTSYKNVIDGNKQYELVVQGSKFINGEEHVMVSTPKILLEDNEFEISHAQVYLQRGEHNLQEAAPKTKKPKKEKDNVLTLDLMYKGPNDTYVSKQRYLQLIQDGCSWCAAPLALNHSETHVFDSHGNVFCADCALEDEVKAFVAGV